MQSKQYYLTAPFERNADQDIEKQHAEKSTLWIAMKINKWPPIILLFWGVSICIVTGYSLIPKIDFPVDFWNADKLYHLAAYGWLAVLPMTGFAVRRTAVLAALSMIILGVLLETAQYYIPGRLFSFLDIISNTAGVFLGIILGNYLRKQLYIA